MPGFITHYTFGKAALKKLPYNYVKDSIKKNIEVYNLGLQGPDIFFYFAGYPLISKKNIGSMLHTKNIKKFFKELARTIIHCKNDDEKEIMAAYTAGFLGHYSLDKTCHPYVYYKSGYKDIREKNNMKYHEKHVCLESDIDNVIAKKRLKKSFSDINYRNLVKLDKEQLMAVSELLNRACNRCYKGIRFNRFISKMVIKNFGVLIGFFNDRKGRRFKIINKIERLFMGCGFVSPLINGDFYNCHFNDPLNLKKNLWFNPWDDERNKKYLSFVELWNIATGEFGEYIEILNEAIRNNDVDIFGDYIENCSYLSGLKVD